MLDELDIERTLSVAVREGRIEELSSNQILDIAMVLVESDVFSKASKILKDQISDYLLSEARRVRAENLDGPDVYSDGYGDGHVTSSLIVRDWA